MRIAKAGECISVAMAIMRGPPHAAKRGRKMKRAALASLALALAGCAITNETAVLVGTARSPTSPEQVKLYTTPPKRYVEIAIVSADAAHDFMSKQALLEKSIQNAKVQAAKVGANGILLDSLGDTQLGSAGVVTMVRPVGTAPAFGTVGTANRTGKQITGKAIFVTEE
jgi:hypothetical protein